MTENNRGQLAAAQVFFFFSATMSEVQCYILLSDGIIAHLK